VSSFPLIDNIIATCLEESISCLDVRFKSLTKELEDYSLEEDTLRKSIKKLESDRQREEEKIAADQQKTNEPSAKDGKKLGVKNTPKPAANAKSVITNEGVNPIHVILEEIKSFDNKLQQLVANKDKMVSKKKMLVEFKEKYDAFNLEKKKLKIDLVDVNGDRLNIHTKGDAYANSYLIDRQCYELHRSYNSKKNFLIEKFLKNFQKFFFANFNKFSIIFFKSLKFKIYFKKINLIKFLFR
jgi:hypothetical protein